VQVGGAVLDGDLQEVVYVHGFRAWRLEVGGWRLGHCVPNP
jgi:hypothetical protein